MAATGGVLMKVGGLVVKTMAKPVARQLKADAQHIAWLRNSCMAIGQGSHYFVRRVGHATSMYQFNKPYKHIDLKNGDALEKGSESLSEGLILSVAVAVAVYEYDKGVQKKADAEARHAAAEVQRVADLGARLARIEAGLAGVEAALASKRPARSWWGGPA